MKEKPKNYNQKKNKKFKKKETTISYNKDRVNCSIN